MLEINGKFTDEVFFLIIGYHRVIIKKLFRIISYIEFIFFLEYTPLIYKFHEINSMRLRKSAMKNLLIFFLSNCFLKSEYAPGCNSKLMIHKTHFQG
jgi:hypothetical protein